MLKTETLQTDVLVVGAGVAGLRAALAARAHGVSVTLIARGSGASPHYDAINAPLGDADPRDNPDVYYQDMLNSGGVLNHRSLVRTLADRAVPAVAELEAMGLRFDKTEDRYVQRLVSGGSYRRAVYIQDRAGREICHILRKLGIRAGVDYRSPVTIIELIRAGNGIAGVLAMDSRKNRLWNIRAKSIVMAAGGIGNLYPFTSYPKDITGDGIVLAYRAGADLVDMEFVQFEPTGVYAPKLLRGFLVPTALFGEGGVLLNRDHKRFVAATSFESESRAHKHELSLLIAREAGEDRALANGGVFFDGSAIPRQVLDSYPLRQKRLKTAGIDLKTDRVEVGPVAHSMIGGIRIDASCRTNLAGLFAAGEVAGGLHGANRMAGNGGSETIVFGKIAGDNAGRYAASNGFTGPGKHTVFPEEIRVRRIMASEQTARPTRKIKSEIGDLMDGAAGVIRHGSNLASAINRLTEIQARELDHLSANSLSGIISCLEVQDMGLLARIILSAAGERQESRGAHYRSDFPDRDDNRWIKNIIVTRSDRGDMGIRLQNTGVPALDK
jgi:succinate dehydrogenase/fumarate reductase flavoprotein subunit